MQDTLLPYLLFLAANPSKWTWFGDCPQIWVFLTLVFQQRFLIFALNFSYLIFESVNFQATEELHMVNFWKFYKINCVLQSLTTWLHLMDMSKATANLTKSEELVTNTTAASKYIPKRPLLFKISLVKVPLNVSVAM